MVHSVELIMEFADKILANFWSPHNILVWNLNKAFQSFVGSKLLNFIKNISHIVKFLKDKFHLTPKLKHLCNGLELWEKITPFLIISVIENDEIYKQEMLAFSNNLKKFYAAGKHTFLTKNAATPGDDEKFYLHCLRFYLPRIAQKIYNENHLGLGIFTMQGFERRNKESKNVFKRFRNERENVLVSNMKRLYDVFFQNSTS